MRTTSLTALFIFLYFLSSVAQAEVVLNPRGTGIGQRILSYKNYDDIRIDADGDGSIDTWYLKKGSTTITITYFPKGIIDQVDIRRYSGQYIDQKVFRRSGKNLNLVSAISRPSFVMFGHVENDICEDPSENLNQKVASLKSDIDAIVSASRANTNSCQASKIPNFPEVLSKGLFQIDDNSEKIANCLNNAGTIKSIDMKLVSSKFLANIKKLLDERSDTVFTCQVDGGKSLRGVATEEGKIKLVVPQNMTDPKPTSRDILVLVTHELLHISGIKDEELATSVTKLCLEYGHLSDKDIHKYVINKNVEITTDNDAKNGRIESASEIASASAVKNQKNRNISSTSELDSNVDMKSNIANAEAIIPSSEKLASASTDKSPAGKEQALRESVSESTPVFRMANQVMGASNTPAIADSSDSSSSSSSSASYSSGVTSEVGSSGSSRSSSRSVAGERYQQRHGRYQSKDGVGSDEYVAEEIDLTKNAESQTARNSQNRREPAARSYQSDTQAYQPQASASSSRGPASTNDEVSKSKRTPAGAKATSGGDTAAVGGSTGSGSANLDNGSAGGGSGGSTASNSRSQKSRSASASRAPASTNQGSPAQRRELMDGLKDDNYILMKRKLREQSYQDELSSNGITVMDTYGGRWGATQGTVIYLDNGDRFIRQR